MRPLSGVSRIKILMIADSRAPTVGVVQGVLEERNLIRVDPDHSQDIGIDLRRGGPILLGEGTVTTFVPNPDHIHKTGVPEGRELTVSLHLYGRAMNSFPR